MKKIWLNPALLLVVPVFLLQGYAFYDGVSYDALAPFSTPVTKAAIPSRTIIALGEATHGNKEFTQLKKQIFEYIVTQNGVRVFAIEGDFGGSQKVNAYIQTGEGSAEDAAKSIGFAIYRTQEMVDLLAWMRDFNASRESSDQIRFYGFDMQRYDHNKEELFSLLSNADSELSASYEQTLAVFTDKSMNDLDQGTIKTALERLEELNKKLASGKDAIIAATSEMEYDLMQQYATCLIENTQLRITSNYGTERDAFMADKVSWLLAFEEKYYGSRNIFITGHNSHIGKTTVTVGIKKGMGEILSERYGDTYFAVGTEFYTSSFLAPDAGSGARTEFTIKNKNNKRLAGILHTAGLESLYLDLDAAAGDETVKTYLEQSQPMSAVGESFSSFQTIFEKGYTQNIVPLTTYDALIFVDSVTPSTMLK